MLFSLDQRVSNTTRLIFKQLVRFCTQSDTFLTFFNFNKAF